MKMFVSFVLACLVGVGLCHGAALSADRPISQKAGEYAVLNVASGTVIYAGALVAVDTNNYAVPATDTATLKVVGVATAGIDQRASLYDSSKRLMVRRGVFLFKNGGSLVDGNIGDWAYVEDDQTVSTAAEMSNDILAGVIIDVETDGVWVDVGAVNRAGAIAGSTIAASGNASVGGTLAVTGNTTLGGTAGVTGNATVGGTLGVTGATTLTGALAANGGVNCDSGKFTVADTTGNTAIGGTLAVAGGTTLNGTLTATNAVAFTGLPTSTNGLSAGALWVDTDTIKIKQ